MMHMCACDLELDNNPASMPPKPNPIHQIVHNELLGIVPARFVHDASHTRIYAAGHTAADAKREIIQ